MYSENFIEPFNCGSTDNLCDGWNYLSLKLSEVVFKGKI
jgi:hypothetical protein